jgi:hypothetical protein
LSRSCRRLRFSVSSAICLSSLSLSLRILATSSLVCRSGVCAGWGIGVCVCVCVCV